MHFVNHIGAASNYYFHYRLQLFPQSVNRFQLHYLNLNTVVGKVLENLAPAGLLRILLFWKLLVYVVREGQIFCLMSAVSAFFVVSVSLFSSEINIKCRF